MNTQNTTSIIPKGNPFTPGKTITSREKFFGREKELIQIKARLRNMLSVSIVGKAKIGRSSLLRALQTHVARWEYYLPIYLSMEAYGTKEGFCRALLKQLLPYMRQPNDNLQVNEQRLQALEQRFEQRDAFTFEETVEILELAHAWGLRVVLLLDEFKDLLEKAEEFDDAFRGQLRSLYTSGTVALVLATRQPITHIPQLNAYFANGITMQELDLLQPNAAKALLEQPHDHPFSAEEINLGLQIGKNHPLRLQLVGAKLYFWKTQDTNPLYHAPMQLHTNAYNILYEPVQEQFEFMMSSSKPPTGSGLVGGGKQWFKRYIVQPTTNILTFTVNMQGYIAAIIFLLASLIFILSSLGLVSPTYAERLLDLLQKGS